MAVADYVVMRLSMATGAEVGVRETPAFHIGRKASDTTAKPVQLDPGLSGEITAWGVA